MECTLGSGDHIFLFCTILHTNQIGKFAECTVDLSNIQTACAAVFVSLSKLYCFLLLFTKISLLEMWLKFKVRGREIGHAKLSSLAYKCDILRQNPPRNTFSIECLLCNCPELISQRYLQCRLQSAHLKQLYNLGARNL